MIFELVDENVIDDKLTVGRCVSEGFFVPDFLAIHGLGVLLQAGDNLLLEMLQLFDPDTKMIGELVGQGLVGLADVLVDELFGPQV